MPAQNRRTNIFIKYFILFSAILLLSFTILGSALMVFVSKYWQNEKTDLLKENTKTVAEMVHLVTQTTLSDISGENRMWLSRFLKTSSISIGADVFIVDTSGKVTLCKEKDGVLSLVPSVKCTEHASYHIDQQTLERIYKQTMITKNGRISREDTARYFIVANPIEINGENIGAVFAVIPGSGLQNYTTAILKMFLLSAIFAVLLSFIGVYFMTYHMIKPLQQMSKATTQFANGNFSYRVKVPGNDEMADLADAFNKMAQSLATLESSRRSFVANVSHELKTPMTTIGGFIDGILDGTIPPEKESYYLKIVSDEVRRLARLVVAMLNMSKIEAGQLQMKPVEYDIADQIFHVFLSFEQKIEQSRIEVLGLDKMQSLMVEADQDMIYQVIYNLVDNAVKFTNEGGYIAVSAVEENRRVIVRIKNSGAGISPEELSKIFERFYKVDRSRSLDVKGAGLGLYLVKNMVEMHKGQITARSEEGQYTEFIFWIPMRYISPNPPTIDSQGKEAGQED